MPNNLLHARKCYLKFKITPERLDWTCWECPLVPGWMWTETHRSVSWMGTGGALAQWSMNTSEFTVPIHSLGCETRNLRKLEKTRRIIFQHQTYNFHTLFPHYLYLLRSDHKTWGYYPARASSELLGSWTFWGEILKSLGQQHLLNGQLGAGRCCPGELAPSIQ